jgi:hypothetical protein
VQEEGSLPGMQWRASVAKVCTSEARKIRVPLARARGGASQEGLVSLFVRVGAHDLWGGRCGKERPAEVGGARREAARVREETSSLRRA